jgi:uncharacterized OsmC-like protein
MTTQTTTESPSPTTPSAAARPMPAPRNGVDTPLLLGTIGVVRQQRELGKFQFRATNRWLTGTHSRTRIESFSGAGGEHEHALEMTYDGDHPKVLVGADRGPTPVEFLLHALASCLTAGIANIAAARGVTLTAVESRLEGDIDLSGIFGFQDAARNGYQRIRASFTIRGDAPPARLREIVAQSQARSAVYDVLTNGTAIDITVDA